MKKTLIVAISLVFSLGFCLADPKPTAYRGEIVKSDGRLVLVEAVTRAVFQLDNQKKAKSFAGIEVLVTGTLDSANMMIHVKGIQTAPGVQNTAEWGVR